MEKKRVLLGFAFLTIVCTLLVLFVWDFPLLNAGKTNIFKIENISMEMMTKGISGVPFRIYSWDYFAYGYSSAFYLNDIFLYVPSFFVLLGMKVEVAYKFFILILILLSYVTSKKFIKIINKENYLFVSNIYLIISILFSCIVPSKYFGDYTIFIFLPIYLIGLKGLLNKKSIKPSILKVTISFSAMVFSNIFLSVLIVIVSVVCIIYKRYNIKSILKYLVISFVFVIGICSYYIFPLTENSFLDYSIKNYSIAEERGETIKSNNSITKSIERKRDKIIVKYWRNNFDDTYIEVPLFMYEGYVAIDDETDEELKLYKSKSDLMIIKLNDSVTGEIEIFYRGTKIQNLSVFVTILSLIILIIYIYKEKGDRQC